MSATAQLRQLNVDFDEGDVCFAPGDLISGIVLVGVSQQHQPADHLSVYQHSDEEEEPPDSDTERSQCFEIVELRMRAHGGARVKGKNRGQGGREQSYFDLELELVGSEKENYEAPADAVRYKMADRLIKPGSEKEIKFEFRLPEKGLCTSLESKSASILYVLRVSLTYRNLNNEIRRVNAVRGFSVVECFDLARIGNYYFQPTSHQLAKKFGLFSCTGGQIRLHFAINRSAFVCGEHMIIEGRIDNRTDRRVDKVAAVLQQVVVVHGSQKGLNLNLLDVTDIHEDNLALFVDQGTSLKIERNFAIPPLPPSCFSPEGHESADFATGGRNPHMGAAHVTVDSMSRRYRRLSSNTSANQENRFLKVLYQLSVRVKTGGVEVMEINVPILIGSLPPRKSAAQSSSTASAVGTGSADVTSGKLAAPLSSPKPQNAFSRAAAETAACLVERGGTGHPMFALNGEEEGEPMAMFIHNRKEGSAKLGQPGDTYICNRSLLNFTNKYPFYVNLPTSSKQSRKVSMLANAIRAENTIVHAFRLEQQQQAADKAKDKADKTGLKRSCSAEPGAKDNSASAEGRTDTSSSTVYSEPAATAAPRPSRAVRRTMTGPRRASALPPVEVLAEHMSRAGLAGSAGGSGSSIGSFRGGPRTMMVVGKQQQQQTNSYLD